MPWSKTSTRKSRTLLAATLLLALIAFGLRSSSSGHGLIFASQSPTPAATPGLIQQPSPSATPSPLQSAPSGNPTPGPPPFFVMIDPGHGGDDQGATFGGKLVEKDITLALGRRLKSELHVRGIPARLLRDSDVTLSLEQRAENANEQHAAVYVSLHAGMPGQGVRVYAPALASSLPPSSVKFLPWESAQANSLPRSRELARKIAGELDKRNLTTISLATPLRPLNNIVAPAVAVELAPDPDNMQDVVSQKFQITVAAGIAAAIAELRPQLEKQP